MRLNKNLTFSLRTTLVAAVIMSAVLAIVLTVGVIGIPAYRKTTKSVRGLWGDLAQQVAQTATEQIQSYFQTAPATLRLIEGLIEEDQLNVLSPEMLFDICYRALKANPEFVNVYYAKLDGSLYAVFRMGDDFLGSYRMIEGDKTFVRNYHIGPGMKWVLTNEEISGYDPRKRPFWEKGIEHPEGTWTEPYLFDTTNATGYSYVLGQKEKGDLKGFWTVDFQIDYLSEYLKTLNVGKEGVVYLLSNDGKEIASSAEGKEISLPPEALSQESRLFNAKHQLFYVNRFPEQSQIPWNLVTVINEDDFLQPVRENALHALAIGLIPCLLFLLAVALFFGKLSLGMKKIAKEMDLVGNLSIEIKPDEDLYASRIREVNMMIHSLHKMKVGLHSFSKYVPVDLVKKLIHSGLPAILGGEKKEMTVLFADLAHFTTLSELFTPDEIVQILADFFDTSSQEILKERGTIDKFIGDAIMALWGAPDRIADHALHACKAALAMKKRAITNARISHKIGINTGVAMVGNYGSVDRMDYTAIGDMVNIAARLEKLNKMYKTQILIGPDTAEAVKGSLLVRPIDWTVLQGRAHATLIYELIDHKKHASETLLHAVQMYTEALDAYRKRNFALAIELFKKADALFGGADTASQILIKRCLGFEKSPPPDHWDGVAATDA